jgi:hypothetical protein
MAKRAASKPRIARRAKKASGLAISKGDVKSVKSVAQVRIQRAPTKPIKTTLAAIRKAIRATFDEREAREK